MRPQIDFQHVLNELSVNRHDPCEVVRELVSNAYDAGASEIRYAAAPDQAGFVFFDNGSGLESATKTNGITPYEAFFSIGKSTKKRGDGGIGYKCQGSKLCFACSRILVLTRSGAASDWLFKIVENPRSSISEGFDISPSKAEDPSQVLTQFFGKASATSQAICDAFADTLQSKTGGTLIAVLGFDTENFARYLFPGEQAKRSYIYNYIRHFTRHGDTRSITKAEGFKSNQILQVASKLKPANFLIWSGKEFSSIPYGFPYLEVTDEPDVKGPEDVARLRDGNFYARSAKKISFSGKTYSLILTVDGNRRAHVGYSELDRKGTPRSGVRLVDQRGLWISASGIKITRYSDLFFRPELEKYAVLAEADAQSHYQLVIDGDFELVTNRNALSRSASSVLENGNFVSELKQFLDSVEKEDGIFGSLLSRLNREQSEARLNQQIEILDASKLRMTSRERFRIDGRLFVSPNPGEEYLVGVLYAELGAKVKSDNEFAADWKIVLTFSTQGIDSLAMEIKGGSLKSEHLRSVEYKYEFSNAGPFNHALSIVDVIVAWGVNLDPGQQVHDQYGCFGNVYEIRRGKWEIREMESTAGQIYEKRVTTVIDLKQLISDTFPEAKFTKPPVL